jgi:hypothetical protein
MGHRDRAAYRAAVVKYLMSPLGRDASEAVAAMLLAVEPHRLGISDEPDQVIIHTLRAFLEAKAKMAGLGDKS